MLTMAKIQRATADAYGLPLRIILGRSRRRDHARPRQVAMYLSRKILGKSLPDIGRSFHRDHTTVLHAVELVASDPALLEQAAEIEEAL